RPGLRQSAYGDRRERDPDPGRDLRELVGVAQLEQARRTSERDGGNEPRDWKQAMLAEERNELACGDDECNEIHRAERALENEAREPVIGSVQPVHRRPVRAYPLGRAEAASRACAGPGR